MRRFLAWLCRLLRRQDDRPGCVLVRALIGGQWRMVRLLEPIGFHVLVETIDSTPSWCQQLVTDGQIHPDDLKTFTKYRRKATAR